MDVFDPSVVAQFAEVAEFLAVGLSRWTISGKFNARSTTVVSSSTSAGNAIEGRSIAQSPAIRSSALRGGGRARSATGGVVKGDLRQRSGRGGGDFVSAPRK